MYKVSSIHISSKQWKHHVHHYLSYTKLHHYNTLIHSDMPGEAFVMGHIEGLVQERCSSSALAMELRVSCPKPSIHPTLMCVHKA